MIPKLSQALFSMLLVAFLAFTGVAPAYARHPVPPKNAAAFEVRFMKDMLDHHRLAIIEAETCLEKAESALLRRRCENIITSRSLETQMMQSWLESWYGTDYQPQRSRSSMRRLGKLEGAVFEIRLMDIMIKHNRQVIRVSNKCLERAYHPELLHLCRKIAAAQTVQIERMQSWLCEWYLACRKYY